MWWLIPAVLTAALVWAFIHVGSEMTRRIELVGFLFWIAAALALIWGAGFAIRGWAS